MPSYRVYVCDRCSKRLEAEFFGPGWCQINTMYGFPEHRDDDTAPPDEDTYVLCDECSPDALARLRSWVAQGDSPQH